MTVLETVYWLEDTRNRPEIIVYMKEGYQLEGTFRGRIRDKDNAIFDWRDGKAIWLTNIMEHFITIDDIEKLEVLA